LKTFVYILHDHLQVSNIKKNPPSNMEGSGVRRVL